MFHARLLSKTMEILSAYYIITNSVRLLFNNQIVNEYNRRELKLERLW